MTVILIKAAQLLLCFCILILLHEGGHFFFAKVFGIRVSKFCLFFDPWIKPLKLFSYKGTDYCIGWLPLGGYVSIEGMVDESKSADDLGEEIQPWEFRAKPAWQRLLVMVGGVLVNFVLAFFIYAMVFFSCGENYVPARDMSAGYSFNEEAIELGFQDGDIVVAADGEEFKSYSGNVFRTLSRAHNCTVVRNGQEVVLPLPGDLNLLHMANKETPFLKPIKPEKPYTAITKEYNLLEAFPAGISHGWNVLTGYVSDLQYIFSKEGAQSVGSFGTIGDLFPATWNWPAFWELTAFISLMLAFMNFLPIPALDGGYIFLTLLELITRRKFPDKFIEKINNWGMYFLFALMALAIFNDINRFIL